MAQFKGDVQFVSSLSFESKKPLDARTIVDLKEDLISEFFSTYLYKGITVTVVKDSEENNGTYLLLGDNPRVETSWIKLASKQSVDNITKIVAGSGIQLGAVDSVTKEQKISVKLKTGANMVSSTEEDGILVTGDLKYTANTGKLVIIDSEGNEIGGGINLPLGQIIVPEKCRYDSKTEELVIVFGDAAGNETEVRIPAVDLITEWVPKNTSSIRLNKTRVVDGTDELTAELILKTPGVEEKPNAIIIDENGVYVEDKTEEINQLRQDLIDDEEAIAAALTKHEDTINSLFTGENSIDSKIEKAKSELKGDVTEDGNTLGKLEDRIDAIINDNASPNSTTESYSVNKVNQLFSSLKIQDSIDGNATTATITSDSKLKIDINVDESSIIVKDGKIMVDTVDGGTF